MAKKPVIHLFIARDPMSAKLEEMLRQLLEEIDEAKRPVLKVHVADIDSPDKFPEYMAIMEDLLGGIYLVDYRRYDVRVLPTIVYKGRKILEGHFPTENELREVLAYENLLPPPIPTTPAVTERQAVEEQPVRPAAEETMPVSFEAGGLEPQLPPPEQIYAPPKEPVPEHGSELTYGPPKVGLRVEREFVAKPQLEAEAVKAQEAPKLERPQPQAKEAEVPPVSGEEGVCGSCIFFDASTRRCLLLRVQVTDVNNPPCGRKFKK